MFFSISGATDNHGRNILKLPDALLNFLCTTSKKKRDYGTYELTHLKVKS